jgi:hypothetical protein
VGATPGVPPSLPGFSPLLSPRVLGGRREQTFEQFFPTETMVPTWISAGLEVVLSVRIPFRSISWPISLSAEKLPVSFAQTDSPLRTISVLSAVERWTHPSKLEAAGRAGCGDDWPRRGIAREHMHRANIRVAAVRSIFILPAPSTTRQHKFTFCYSAGSVRCCFR